MQWVFSGTIKNCACAGVSSGNFVCGMVGKGVAIQLGVWEQGVVRLCETAILSATSGLSRRITVHSKAVRSSIDCQ